MTPLSLPSGIAVEALDAVPVEAGTAALSTAGMGVALEKWDRGATVCVWIVSVIADRAPAPYYRPNKNTWNMVTLYFIVELF